MSVSYLGSKSVGEANIGVALALPALATALHDLTSRLAAAESKIAANLTLISTPLKPTDLLSSLTAAVTGFASNIETIVASIPGPLLDANLSLASEIGGLLVLQAAITATVSTLTAAASAGGIHVLKIDSTPATVGSELAGLVSGGIGGGLSTARIQGVAFVTESPAAFSAMSGVLLTG